MIGSPMELMGQNICCGPTENVGQAADSARFIQTSPSEIQGDKTGQ